MIYGLKAMAIHGLINETLFEVYRVMGEILERKYWIGILKVALALTWY
jgi:hypothetical protein